MRYKIRQKTKDHIGKRFNRLIVLSATDKRDKTDAVLLECLCDCGKITFTTKCRLDNGSCGSCGCLRKESRNLYQRLPKGVAGFNAFYNDYRRHALKRNLSFNLSKEQFRKITQMNCSYCGQLPNHRYDNSHSNVKKETIEHGTYIGNGVDRIDSKKGYTIDNSAACCWPCNDMKKTSSVNDFINHCTKVANYSIMKQPEPATEVAPVAAESAVETKEVVNASI